VPGSEDLPRPVRGRRVRERGDLLGGVVVAVVRREVGPGDRLGGPDAEQVDLRAQAERVGRRGAGVAVLPLPGGVEPGTRPVGSNRSTSGVSSVVGDASGLVGVDEGSGAAEEAGAEGERPVSGVRGESSVLVQAAVRTRPASTAAADSRDAWWACMPPR
jgi:hypothetical protein